MTQVPPVYRYAVDEVDAQWLDAKRSGGAERSVPKTTCPESEAESRRGSATRHRQAYLDFSGSYDLPVVNITAEHSGRNLVVPAKARGPPLLAALPHCVARTNLAFIATLAALLNSAAEVIHRV